MILTIIIIGLIVWQVTRYLDQERYAHLMITAGLNDAQKSILSKYFRYYLALPQKSKKIFEYRVAKFIRLKKFVPRRMDEVTMEMKVLIAASAIQLSFGFPQVFLSYFKYIVIYPDQFLSNTSGKYHKGEVNPREKAIVLSWKHFVEGYTEPEGVNLGLHEMAHALQLENVVMNTEYDFLHPEYIQHWQKMASEEMKKIQAGDTRFFRAYGGTNHHEFFAVAVENFFERPREFMEHSPETYKALTNLLHQDPIRLYEEL